MQSSSSAMAISPMGIINACNPRQAALETMDVASFIHNGASGYCRDAACAMAAAVAAAFDDNATVESVVDAATRYLLPVSAGEIKQTIADALDLAAEAGSYERFRENYYAKFQRSVLADSMETIPATLAILTLAGGDPERSITWGRQLRARRRHHRHNDRRSGRRVARCVRSAVLVDRQGRIKSGRDLSRHGPAAGSGSPRTHRGVQAENSRRGIAGVGARGLSATPLAVSASLGDDA